MIIGRLDGGRGTGAARPVARSLADVVPAADHAPTAASLVERITLDELRRLQGAGEQVWLLDVRTERTYAESETKARGAIRLSPEGNVAARAAELALPRHDWLVAYCA